MANPFANRVGRNALMRDNAPVGSVMAPGGVTDTTYRGEAPASLASLFQWSGMVPGLGDLTGPIGDAMQLYSEPESRTAANIGLAALGVLPLFPSLALLSRAGGDELGTLAKRYPKQLGIVPPTAAKKLNIAKALPESGEFMEAVSNTPGAKITDDGLLIRIQRNQKPEQGMAPSVRGGVFYLPEGAAQSKYYSTGKYGYGGQEKIAGETLVRNPLFVKGATGGKAPEAAYDAMLGKGAYERMRSDAMKAYGRYGSSTHDKAALADEFLDQYAPELSGMGSYIVEKSKDGNQLAYALQEAAVSSEARRRGHDAVIGYSKGRKGKGAFISELLDVREDKYPDKFGSYSVHDSLSP